MDELRGSVDPRAFKMLEETFENEGWFDGELLVAIHANAENGFIAYDRTEITWP